MKRLEEGEQKCKREKMVFACSGVEHAPSVRVMQQVQSVPVSHAVSTGVRCINRLNV